MIENRFFPQLPDRPGRTVTARDDLSAMENTITITIPNESDMSNLLNSDSRLLTTAINIACKAEGLPKATIAWIARDSNNNEVFINTSNIFVPRPGRSIYSIDPRTLGNDIITYECRGTNEAGEATGFARIVPQCT